MQLVIESRLREIEGLALVPQVLSRVHIRTFAIVSSLEKKYFTSTASWILYTLEAAWTRQFAGFFIFNVQLCDWSIHAQEVDVDLHVFQVRVAQPFYKILNFCH